MSKLLKYIDPEQLVFDAVMIAFLFVFHSGMNFLGFEIMDIVTPLFGKILFFVVISLVSWFLGGLYKRYADKFPKRKTLFTLLMIMILVFVYFNFLMDLDELGIVPGALDSPLFMTLALVLGIVLAMVCFSMGYSGYGNPLLYFFPFIGILAICGSAFLTLAVFVFFIVDVGSIFLAILVDLGLIVAIGFLFMLVFRFIGFWKKLKKESSLVRSSTFYFNNVFIPLIIVLVLLIWEKIYLESGLEIFSALIFSGILPLRFLMAFSPDRKIINMFLGICALAGHLFIL